ncbi:MAG: N-acetylglucosamine-6-phosphate deacetylase [Streptosporangiaceae bacterium]|jgi:N-acetylglucosamine-6-phosphate deacetylase
MTPGDGRRRPDLLIAAARVIPATTGSPTIAPGYVAVADGVITDVGAGPPPRAPDVGLVAGTLLPGLVDLQVNGYFGVELMTAGAAGWTEVAARLPETGTTAFLPTFITAPIGQLSAALRATAGVVPAIARGARVLGVHVEGPFIAPSRRGAHNEAWISTATPAAVDELLAAGGGLLAMVTLAPELDGALAAIDRLTGAGVIVSVGHSDATARQVAQAASRGARMVTHLFDAQRPLHHREPGVVGQALADPRLTSGLIADLRHVCAAVCKIAFDAAPGRIVIVTDAAACAGMPPGRYQLGGQPIELPPGEGAPPVRADGTLAGSGLRMDTGIANMVTAGVGLADAVAAASRIPADLIGRPELGRIAPGAAADLVWLGDDMRTNATWVGGELVYTRTRPERAGSPAGSLAWDPA